MAVRERSRSGLPPSTSVIMKSSKLRALLTALPTRPSATDLEAIVEELVRACSERRQWRKSVALYMRNAKDAAPQSVLEAISRRVTEHLDSGALIKPAPARPVTGALVDINEAAMVLGLRRETLTERVKLPQYRYLYGWPFWDGHQWWFSSPAIDPGTRAEFLARLPKHEPDAHVAMLPAWCARQTVAADAHNALVIAP